MSGIYFKFHLLAGRACPADFLPSQCSEASSRARRDFGHAEFTALARVMNPAPGARASWVEGKTQEAEFLRFLLTVPGQSKFASPGYDYGDFFRELGLALRRGVLRRLAVSPVSETYQLFWRLSVVTIDGEELWSAKEPIAISAKGRQDVASRGARSPRSA